LVGLFKDCMFWLKWLLRVYRLKKGVESIAILLVKATKKQAKTYILLDVIKRLLVFGITEWVIYILENCPTCQY